MFMLRSTHEKLMDAQRLELLERSDDLREIADGFDKRNRRLDARNERLTVYYKELEVVLSCTRQARDRSRSHCKQLEEEIKKMG